MLKLTIRKKVQGKWWTKRKFLESCDVANLSWMKDGNNCIKLICPICQKEGTTLPEGSYYHPLDLWEHLDHHPQVEIKIDWKIRKKGEFSLFDEKNEEDEILVDYEDCEV